MNRNIKMKNEKEEKKHGRRRKGPAVDVGVPAREICEVVEVVKPSCPVDATGAPAHQLHSPTRSEREQPRTTRTRREAWLDRRQTGPRLPRQ